MTERILLTVIVVAACLVAFAIAHASKDGVREKLLADAVWHCDQQGGVGFLAERWNTKTVICLKRDTVLWFNLVGDPKNKD